MSKSEVLQTKGLISVNPHHVKYYRPKKLHIVHQRTVSAVLASYLKCTCSPFNAMIPPLHNTVKK